MESKLLIIGVLMFLFSYRLKKSKKAEDFLENKKAAVFHSLFWIIVAGILLLVLTINLEGAHPSGLWSKINRYPFILWPFTLGLAGCYGYFRFKKVDKEKKEKIIKNDLDWSDSIFPVMVIGAFIMFFFIQGFKIPSGSMKNTLLIGDHLFVNKMAYGLHIPFSKARLFSKQPKQGEIVVFKFPSVNPDEEFCGSPQYGKDFIKRVIAVGGDTLEIKEGRAYVNGVLYEDAAFTRYVGGYRMSPYLIPEELSFQDLLESRKIGDFIGPAVKDNMGPVVIPENSYFVMGDNRDESCDSRFWGVVPDSYLKGRAWIIFFPFARVGSIK